MEEAVRRCLSIPDPDELTTLVSTNTCGVDPDFDNLSDQYLYDRELDEYGADGIRHGIMWTRLCSTCKSFGKNACKPAPPVNRTAIILSRHTQHVNDDCPICYAPMRATKLAKTSCGHMFHSKCLVKWAQRSWPNENCPICREELEDIWAFLDLKEDRPY